MLATCRTAISQLPSTMICNNLTKCCGVYWNCRNWRNINLVTCSKDKKKQQVIARTKDWSTRCDCDVLSTTNKEHIPLEYNIHCSYQFYTHFSPKKMNDTWCSKSKNKKANWEESPLRHELTHKKGHLVIYWYPDRISIFKWTQTKKKKNFNPLSLYSDSLVPLAVLLLTH